MNRRSAIKLRLFWAVMFAVGVTLAVHCLAIVLLARQSNANEEPSVPYIATPCKGDLHAYALFSWRDEKGDVRLEAWEDAWDWNKTSPKVLDGWLSAKAEGRRCQREDYYPTCIGFPLGSTSVFVRGDLSLTSPVIVSPWIRFGRISWPEMLANFVVYAVAYLYLGLTLREHRSWRHRFDGRCGACGYDLRGSGRVCPECGEVFVEAQIGEQESRRTVTW